MEPQSRRLVCALLVCAEARLPLASRTFELELKRGTTSSKKLAYTNPYQQPR